MLYQTRTAEQNDINEVYHLVCQLEETIFDKTIFESIFMQHIANSDFIYLVATSAENNIIGFISCHTQYLLHHCGKVAEIQELFVKEQYRSLGIGRHLVNDLQMRLQQCVVLEVATQNKRTATHVFYEQLGFSLTHKKFVKQLG